jgi:hypothetical protein
MVNKTVKLGLFILSIIFLIGFVSASFTLGNVSNGIPSAYGPGDKITGWINISFSNEPSTSIISSSLGGQITLSDLLKKTSNSGFTYTCNPISCTSSYTAQDSDISKILSFSGEQSKIIAFKLTGNVGEISKLSFDVASNNPETEKFPFSIDLLNDGDSEWDFYYMTDNFGVSNFGCLSNMNPPNEGYLTTNAYCERIYLTKAPGVRIGAEVDSDADIAYSMSIQAADGNSSMESCTATAETTGKQIISCIPPYLVADKGNYFVCINTENSGDANKYKIKYETSENPCGFAEPYSGTYSYNFKIFAEQGTYASNVNFAFDDAEMQSANSDVTDLESYIKDYVTDTYNNDCTAGCVIPIKITSGLSQTISITNPSLLYQSNGITIAAATLYDAEESPAEFNSAFGELSIDEAGFFVPKNASTPTFSISIGGNSILQRTITVGNVPSVNYIIPAIIPSDYSVTFQAGTTMGKNITSYKWEFGDGGTVTTNVSKATHTYTEAGSYILKITTTDNLGRSYTKAFTVLAETAAQAIPDILADIEMKLTLIQQKNNLLSTFEKNSLKRIIDVAAISSNLTKIKSTISSGTTEAQYASILDQLMTIRIPDDVGATLTAQGLLYYPRADNVNLDVLSTIYGENYEVTKQQLYKDAAVEWELENTNVAFDYSEISSVYSDYTEESIKSFDVLIDYQGSDDAYAVIEGEDGMQFTAGSPSEESGYYYVKLNNGGQTRITFSTTGNFDFTTLPMIISPSLSKLNLNEDFSPEKTPNKWAKFILLAIVVLIVAIIAWVLLKMWYKRKYENHLFKNKNNLFNIINYIKTSKEKGMNEKDITAQLKKSGWNSEQIAYAMKKFSGKQTGMPDFHINLFDKFKKKKTDAKPADNKNLPK